MDNSSTITLHDISQYDWEKIQRTGNLDEFNLTVDDFYFLLNEYADLIGSRKQIVEEVRQLKEIVRTMCKCVEADNPQDFQLDYDLAMYDLEQIDKKEDVKGESVTPIIRKVYGNINKKDTSAHEYAEMYIAIRDGKIS